MIERVRTPVSVYSLYDHKKRSFGPKIVLWEGRPYKTEKMGYHHTVRMGRILYHIFSVSSKELYFRLVFNTESLLWTVEEISDGEID
jgi:hypothetical protein